MARITGFTSERMLEIEGTTIVDGSINEGGNLILYRRDGFTIDAGKVAGPKGDHGAGVYDVEVTYQAGDSGTIEPTGEWTSNVPIVLPGKYLWTKTLTTYADPENEDVSFTTTTFSVTLQPEKGSDGKGIVTQVTVYQQGVSGTVAPTGNWYPTPPPVDPGKYLWAQTTTTYNIGDPHISYTVAKQGSDGTPGEPGVDGQTQYLHVAYANSADGTVDFSTTNPSGRSYMGTAVSFSETDPDTPSSYIWVVIRGYDGVGILSSNVRYQGSDSGTTAPTGLWTESIPDVPEGEYLWSRSIVNFTDGASQTTYSVSKQGARGADGRSIVDVDVMYYMSDSSSDLIGGIWETIAPEWTDGKFVWSKTVTSYSEGSPTETDPVCITGGTGADGDDAVVLHLSSSHGTTFKNTGVVTDLTVEIFKGPERIITREMMDHHFGESSYLEWQYKGLGDPEYIAILPSDSRLSNDNFVLTVSPADVHEKKVFQCILITP